MFLDKIALFVFVGLVIFMVLSYGVKILRKKKH